MAILLTDIINTRVFQDLPAVNSPEKTALFESGAVVKNPLFDGIASGPGREAELPFWNDMNAGTAPNLSSDIVGNNAVPGIIVQGEQICRKAFLNHGMTASGLVSEIAMGAKAMEQIRARFDTYWTRQWQRRLIATAQGVLASNIINNASDMIFDIAGATNADVTNATVFTRQNFTSAAFTMGDAVDGISAIAVHSVVYKRMIDNNDIVMFQPSQGAVAVPTYLGKRVIVDDSMPVIPAAGALPGDAAPRYTSVLFGNGSFGYGEGNPDVPVEIERSPRAGDGGGVETIWTRKTWILHPYGFARAALPALVSYSPAELAAAATWTRVVVRKNVPLAFLVTNG